MSNIKPPRLKDRDPKPKLKTPRLINREIPKIPEISEIKDIPEIKEIPKLD